MCDATNRAYEIYLPFERRWEILNWLSDIIVVLPGFLIIRPKGSSKEDCRGLDALVKTLHLTIGGARLRDGEIRGFSIIDDARIHNYLK